MIPVLGSPRRVATSGGELSVIDLGEGPAVLFLHGFPTNGALWRREAWLCARRMRVLVPDLLGYGLSERPADADLSEPAQAGYVKELVHTLGIAELAVVGHDIGGGIAQLLALDPDLEVRALVLLDSVAFDAWPIEGIRMLQGATPEQETEAFVGEVLGLIFEVGIAHPERVEPGALEAFVDPWRSDPPSLFRAARGITGRGLSGRDGDLAALDLPAFVIWGEEDPFLPPELAERLGELLAGSTVALLPGCSHFVTEDAPQTIPQLVFEWLRLRYAGDRHGHGPVPAGRVPIYLERPPEGFREDREVEPTAEPAEEEDEEPWPRPRSR